MNPNGIDTVVITSNYGSASRKYNMIVKTETFIQTEVCQGGDYQFLGRIINTDSAGTFNYYGIDTIIQVTIHPSYFIEEQHTVCSNNSYFWHGQTINVAGDYYDSLITYYGCDSIFKLTLIIDSVINIFDTLTLCDNELPVFYNNKFIDKEGNYQILIQSQNDCDSIIYLYVILEPSYDTIISLLFPQSDLPYVFGSQTLTKSGVYSETFSTITGCDSVVHLVLTVGNLSGDTIYTYDSKKICKVDLPYLYGTHTFPIETESGIYHIGFKSFSGKDSIVVLQLTIIDIPNQPDTIIGPIKIATLGKYNYSISPVADAKYYQWNISNSMFVFEDESNTTNATILYIAVAGNGILSVTAGNECGFSTDQQLEIFSAVGIQDMKNNAIVKIYPNPFQDYINVEIQEMYNVIEIQIIDVFGKVVLKQNVNQKQLSIPLTDIANGFYILQLKDNNQQITNYKIICSK